LRELERSIAEAMSRHGFSFIEAITPCPTVYGRMNKRPRGLDEMLYYQQNSVVRNGADPRDVGITIDSPTSGQFLDIASPNFEESRQQLLDKAREKVRL
jgi:2-oxoglutarate ferredoxin oxidoreductase subunit beta